MDREFNSDQKMRAEAIQKGLAGDYDTNYVYVGYFAAGLLCFLLMIALLSRRKKAKI